MITPVESIADALIAFILSLLHDPAAAEKFNTDPQGSLASNGLQGACAADVHAVTPIIVEYPTVTPQPPGPTPPHHHEPVIREISRILNQFTTIDNRSTVVDQSTNQNIWTSGGDLTQIFDQTANVASGDHSMSAGHNINQDQSTNNLQVGDVGIGNTSGSYNTSDNHSTTSTGTPPPADPAAVTSAPAAATVPGTMSATAAGTMAADPNHPTTLIGGIADAHAATVGAVGTAVDAAHAAATAPDTSVVHTEPVAPTPVEDHTYDASEPLTAPEPDTYHLDPELDGHQ